MRPCCCSFLLLSSALLGQDAAAKLQKQEDAIIQRYRQGARPRTPAVRGPLLSEGVPSIGGLRGAKWWWVYGSPLKDAGDLRTGELTRIPAGTGSGFVWDEAGHVVTNYHVVTVEKEQVVEEPDELRVTLADGHTYQARVIGRSLAYDLAVLQVFAPLESLKPLPIGSSQDLVVGQTVLAIGNPFGLDHTLTKGVISALNRDLATDFNTRIRGVVQTDAAINPGNSGGPLLDSAGRVIGMNSAIPAATGASVGIGFAIPIDTLNRVVPVLIRRGQLYRPRMGFGTLSDDQAVRLGVPRGVIVGEVEAGSPAAKAGLKGVATDAEHRITALGDIIVALDGKRLSTSGEMFALLEQAEPKDEVVLDVMRGEKVERLTVKLKDLAK